ncbi:MAG: cupin domain-containing protein [Bacteroidales bacterium]|nr:cupin domain-containing protein [Bacteroidales bacterium]
MKRTVVVLLIFMWFALSVRAQYQASLLVEPLLHTDTTVLGQPIKYPGVASAEVTFSKVTIPPGASTGWHKHLVPVFAYVLSGTLTVELENGETNTFKTSSTFAEVFNVYHNGINKGDTDVVLLAFYLGGDGQPLSLKKDQ